MGRNGFKTKHADLTPGDVANVLPGPGDVMAEVSRVFGNLWFAADGGNWDLAEFYLERVDKLLHTMAITRPKYAVQVEDFARTQLDPLLDAVRARDRSCFADRYAATAARANELHRVTGHGFIRWRRPASPPDPSLDFRPAD